MDDLSTLKAGDRLVMRTLLQICSVLLVLGPGMADAQSDAKATRSPEAAPTAVPEPKGAESDDIRARGEAWFKQCMEDWDTATHMTKKEWERTCRRVSLERTKFLLQQSK